MKVVISTDIYYPMINGVAVFSRNLAAGLHKQGHEVLVLAPSINGPYTIEKDPDFGFTVVRLKSHKVHIYPDQINKVPESKDILGHKLPKLYYKNGLNVSLNCYSTVRRVLDNFKPDIIHDQTPGPVALAVFRYAKKRNIPLVSTDHAYPDNLTQQLKLPRVAKRPINAMMNKYFISFLKRSEYATMPTEQAVADLIPNKRKPFKVPVEALSNGIDLSRFKPGKANKSIYSEYGIPTDKPIVLYVGRVDPEKSLNVLMDAFIEVASKNSDAHLVVVGDGTARPKLEDQIAKANLSDRAHFLGRVVGDNLPQLYRTGTVFAITSKTETQSIVLMEAMASGLPCVAVDAGAIHELVKNDQNGYLCTADDSAAVADGIRKIISSATRREKMSDASIKMAAKHDISHTINRIEEIYTEVLANRNEE